MFFMSANSSLDSDKEPFAEIHQSWMFLNIVRRVTSLKLNYKVEWLIVPILVASIRIWIWLFDTSVLNTIANTMIFSPWNCYDLYESEPSTIFSPWNCYDSTVDTVDTINKCNFHNSVLYRWKV
jgi:hypothetical protein